MRDSAKSGYIRDPQKRSARWKVMYAVKHGKIKRGPCEKCRSLETEGHHDDYSKPLEVRWLCRPHHEEFHSHKESDSSNCKKCGDMQVWRDGQWRCARCRRIRWNELNRAKDYQRKRAAKSRESRESTKV